MNQNINGNYYVLIPGDSSTEWMMNLGNVISMDDVMSGDHWGKVYSIYSNYLTDDINLALENRKQNIYQRARSQELRIMRDILPQNIVEDIEESENLSLQEKEIEMIKRSLEKNNNKRKLAAKELGISERTLYRKIKQYDL